MRLRFWLGIAAAIAIAIGSVIGAALVRSADRTSFEHKQDELAMRAARQTEALAFLAVGQLKAAAALYQLEERLNRHEFDVLSAALLRQGALSATGFASARNGCCRVLHAASGRGAPVRLGVDLRSSRVHAVALREARDSAQPSITPLAPTLLTSDVGLVVYAPVYRDRAPLRSLAQRRRALVGFAAGSFRAADLAAATSLAGDHDAEVQLREEDEVIAGEEGPLEKGSAAPLRIADRTWLLVVRDPSDPSVGLPVLIGVLGISLAALLAALVLIWSRNAQMRELQRQASHDSLTGLKNRRRFEEDLRTELARSRRDASQGALMTIDLDNFKRVNDTLGHPIGDQVIGEMAGVLRRRTRETDVLARLGGDEFAVVLPRCDAAEARSVADAILTAIREHVPDPEEVPPITASIGIAMFGEGHEIGKEPLQAEADTAMYEAKAAGRDAVRVAGEGLGAAADTEPG